MMIRVSTITTEDYFLTHYVYRGDMLMLFHGEYDNKIRLHVHDNFLLRSLLGDRSIDSLLPGDVTYNTEIEAYECSTKDGENFFESDFTDFNKIILSRVREKDFIFNNY